MATADQTTDTGREAADAVVRALRWLLLGSAATFGVVLGSGLYLIWRYRPDEALAWASVQGVDSAVELADRIRTVHQISSRVLLVLLLGTAVVAVVVAFRRRRVLLGALGPAAVVLALAGGISGLLLVWDQLALTRVTVGTNLAGYTWLFDGTGIRYVLVDRSAVSTGEFRSWFLGHTIGIPLALISVGVVMWRGTRHRGSSPPGG